MIRQIILATLCIFIICVGESNGQGDERVGCEASAAYMGGEGEITCLFPKDLDQAQSPALVTVKQYIGALDQHVLTCLWDDIHQCNDVRPGYSLGNATGRSLQIKIPNVIQAHLGNYRCTLMVATGLIDAKPCSLLIKSAVRPTPLPALIDRDRGDGDRDQTTRHDNGSSSNRHVGLIVGAIVGAVLVVGVMLCILAFVFVWYRRRKRCQKDLRVSTKGETDEEQQKSFLHDGQWHDPNDRKRCQKDLGASAKGETDEEQQKSFLHDGQWHDPNDRSLIHLGVSIKEETDEEQEKSFLPDRQGPDLNSSPTNRDGTPVLISNGMQENTRDMQGNNEQNETLDQQEGSPAADRSAVPPAIHSTTDIDVEDAEEAREDLASAPSAADMSGDVSGKPEDKTATTGEEGMLKYMYSRGMESLGNWGLKAMQYGKSRLTHPFGGDDSKAKVPTDSRADTNSHLESSTDVPPVASDATESGTGVPYDEGSTADRTEEETSDTGKDEAAPTEPVDDSVKPSLTTENGADTSSLLHDDVTKYPHHIMSKRRTEEKGEKGVGALTLKFEQLGQQNSTATVSSSNYGRRASAPGRQRHQRDMRDAMMASRTKSLEALESSEVITGFPGDSAMSYQQSQDTTGRTEDSEGDNKGNAPRRTRSQPAEHGFRKNTDGGGRRRGGAASYSSNV